MKCEAVFIFFSILIVAAGFPAIGQECRVLPAPISKDYEGDCRKGLAEGKGIARGKDVTYEGDFRKGMPHGEGILKFADGRTFEGQWRNGEIYGYGEFRNSSGEVKQGYYKGTIEEFRYMGEDKSALPGYRILDTERLENANYTFVNSDPQGRRITIKIFENNIRTITHFEILEITGGVIQLVTNAGGRLNAEIEKVDFPVTIGIRYIIPYGTQDTKLPGNVDNMNSPRIMRFTIMEPGTWTVTITHR
ncbi:MAG: hypothetical protein KFF73_20530 [Cyclobacteriaceae bacterium]|nr:hypothetical protein [Cyclobacteriaceae bacterium]